MQSITSPTSECVSADYVFQVFKTTTKYIYILVHQTKYTHTEN